jgi:predicted DsbA family dithiol-disulfide isomerase
MDTQLLKIAPRPLALELDLFGDLACPWSFIAKRSLERALNSLYGSAERLLRWHGLPASSSNSKSPTSWNEYLASQLAKGTMLSQAQRGLETACHELGIAFAFERLEVLPDTREAHRLVRLASQIGRQGDVIEAVFSAFFEQGRDIARHEVLVELADECHLGAEIQVAFADESSGRDALASDEKRSRGLGIAAVPSLLINGRVLVPGPADVSTYVQALGQALFPEMPAPKDKRRLH